MCKFQFVVVVEVVVEVVVVVVVVEPDSLEIQIGTWV
jgi:hypothetical protein